MLRFYHWPVYSSWLEHHPITERLYVRFPASTHIYIAGLIPGSGAYKAATNRASLSHGCFPLFLPLSLPLSLKLVK